MGKYIYLSLLGRRVRFYAHQFASLSEFEAARLSNKRSRARLRNAVRRGDWQEALMLVSSDERPILASRIWDKVAPADRPRFLAKVISSGDALLHARPFLIEALQSLGAGQLVFDGAAARNRYRRLPQQVQIYRGTVEAEGASYGISWTLDRRKAIWFATDHMRFVNRSSPPVLLSAAVSRNSIRGLCCDRGESEVLVVPNDLRNVIREPAVK